MTSNKLLRLFLLMLMLSACGSSGVDGGTEAGNPPIDGTPINTNTPGDPNGPPVGTALQAPLIMRAMCERMTTCDENQWPDLPDPDASCFAILQMLTTVGPLLGITDGSSHTFQDIYDAESHGRLQVDGNTALTCVTDIKQRHCDATVASATAAVVQAIELQSAMNSSDPGSMPSATASVPSSPSKPSVSAAPISPVLGLVPPSCAGVYIGGNLESL